MKQNTIRILTSTKPVDRRELDYDFFNDILKYDSKVPGCLVWKERPVDSFSHTVNPTGHALSYNIKSANKPAGTLNKGYYGVSISYGMNKRIKGRKFSHWFSNHRIVFLLHNKRFPKPELDIHHKDCVSSNNKIENLEEVTRSVNNTLKFNSNKVNLEELPDGQWKLDIRVSKLFKTQAEAVEYRNKHGY